MLEEEIQTYDRLLPSLLDHHRDRVVLIKGQEVIGFFDKENEALAAGVERFGLTSMLIRRVLPEQPLVYVPALVHGVLSNDPKGEPS